MDDREKLQKFIAQVYAWLDASYAASFRASAESGSPWPPIRAHHQLQELATAAWREYERDHPLADLQRRIAQLPQETLVSHGLYGTQLEYKLATVDFAANRAARAMPGWLRKLLELIDNLLESILKALGADNALKEIKDAMLASLPDE